MEIASRSGHCSFAPSAVGGLLAFSLMLCCSVQANAVATDDDWVGIGFDDSSNVRINTTVSPPVEVFRGGLRGDEYVEFGQTFDHIRGGTTTGETQTWQFDQYAESDLLAGTLKIRNGITTAGPGQAVPGGANGQRSEVIARFQETLNLEDADVSVQNGKLTISTNIDGNIQGEHAREGNSFDFRSYLFVQQSIALIGQETAGIAARGDFIYSLDSNNEWVPEFNATGGQGGRANGILVNGTLGLIEIEDLTGVELEGFSLETGFSVEISEGTYVGNFDEEKTVDFSDVEEVVISTIIVANVHTYSSALLDFGETFRFDVTAENAGINNLSLGTQSVSAIPLPTPLYLIGLCIAALSLTRGNGRSEQSLSG